MAQRQQGTSQGRGGPRNEMWGSFSAVALEGLEQPGPCLVFSLVVVLLTYLEARQMVT